MAFLYLEGCTREFENQCGSDSDTDYGSDLDIDVDDEELACGCLLGSDDESDVEINCLTPKENGDWSDELSEVGLEDFQETSGPDNGLNESSEPMDYFKLFITDEMINLFVEQTNLYAEQRQSISGPDKHWKPVTHKDMRHYLYVNICFGIHPVPNFRLYWMSDKIAGVGAISDVMCHQRYEKITQYFHMADRLAQPGRSSQDFDPLYKVRPLLDHVQQVCSAVYKPDREISINQTTMPFNGRFIFEQCSANKPCSTRGGLKIWRVTETKTGYTLNFSFCTGNSINTAPDRIGHHVILKDASDYLDKYHIFYFDEKLSSVELADDLLDRKTYSCAKTRASRTAWPLRLEGGRKPKKGTILMKQKGQILATQWGSKETVNILSTSSKPTIDVIDHLTKNGLRTACIPTPVLEYSQNTNGLALGDEYRLRYPVGRNGKKWWRCALWFLVQTSMVNAFLLMRKSNPNAQPRSPASDHLYFRLSILRNLLGKVAPKKKVFLRIVPPVTQLVASPKKHSQVRMVGRKKRCLWCAMKGSKTNKGRPVETSFGCDLCQANLCKGLCFSSYHEAL